MNLFLKSISVLLFVAMGITLQADVEYTCTVSSLVKNGSEPVDAHDEHLTASFIILDSLSLAWAFDGEGYEKRTYVYLYADESISTQGVSFRVYKMDSESNVLVYDDFKEGVRVYTKEGVIDFIDCQKRLNINEVRRSVDNGVMSMY